MKLRKSSLAERDLENIYRFGFERFGYHVAESYAESLLNALDLIAENPLMARLHVEFKRPVRIHPHRAHLIVYEVVERSITITRVLSHRQNLFDLL
jgi:toxin ParE1/3/4